MRASPIANRHRYGRAAAVATTSVSTAPIPWRGALRAGVVWGGGQHLLELELRPSPVGGLQAVPVIGARKTSGDKSLEAFTELKSCVSSGSETLRPAPALAPSAPTTAPTTPRRPSNYSTAAPHASAEPPARATPRPRLPRPRPRPAAPKAKGQCHAMPTQYTAPAICWEVGRPCGGPSTAWSARPPVESLSAARITPRACATSARHNVPPGLPRRLAPVVGRGHEGAGPS